MSMSIRTGLPGVGLVCANRAGAGSQGKGMKPARPINVGTNVWGDQWEAWNASSAAWFWSSCTARENQPSESMSVGWPVAIAPMVNEMQQSSPQQNLTMIVFQSV